MIRDITALTKLSDLLAGQLHDDLEKIKKAYSRQQELKTNLRALKANTTNILTHIEQGNTEPTEGESSQAHLAEVLKPLETMLKALDLLEKEIIEQERSLDEAYTAMAEDLVKQVAPDISDERREEYVQQISHLLKRIVELSSISQRRYDFVWELMEPPGSPHPSPLPPALLWKGLAERVKSGESE